MDDESLELLGEEDGDRAEVLVEDVARRYREGSDNERNDEDTTSEFDAEEALSIDPMSDRHLLSTSTIRLVEEFTVNLQL